ncbi:hypothetical protein FGU71_04090 [Erythrobacter insulae]|uniref:Uncharacterized protein n=2 Tax=Erythrobacter insulae TaxID=2584124 RepID=A0A547PAD5_9SPHN|nr:hypothetical protein FGU71_04090 [Erythrobacter insulae]
MRRPLRWKSIAFQLTFGVSLIALVAVWFMLSGHFERSPFLFGAGILMLIMPVVVQLAWHYWQHQDGYSGSPLPVAHETDPIAETLFVELQRMGGPRLFRRSWLTGRYRPTHRRLTSGKLRYLLFSDDEHHLSQVSAFPSFFPLIGPLYLSDEDAETLRQAIGPRRKGGPGRNPLYNYTRASLSVFREVENRVLPNDNDRALREIEDRLLTWFEAHVDASGDMPRRDQVKPYAIEVFQALTSST